MIESPGIVLGLDIGGTKVHGVAFDRGFNQIAEHRMPVGTGGGGVIASTLCTLATLLDRAQPRPLTAIGLGIPGQVDRVGGSVRQAVNLGIGNRELDIVARITRTYPVPCEVDNDVNVAALGAGHLMSDGSARTDLAYLSIGTGIAAGLIVNGRLHRGDHGVAGEIGHFPVVVDGHRCECGLHGCLETVASGAAIARRWPAARGDFPTESLLAAVDRGDIRARTILESVTDHLSTAVYLLAITYDLDKIVIGGGVADLGTRILDPIKDAIRRLEARSEFVTSLKLADRVAIKPSGPVSALGAALLTEPGQRL